MHQAFPRECPYPHLTGTTTSLNPDKWVEHHGIAYRIDINVDNKRTATYKDAMNREIQSLDSQFALAADDAGSLDPSDGELMWTTEEEHFVVPTQSLLEQLCPGVCTVLGMLTLVGVAVYVKHFVPCSISRRALLLIR